MKIKNDRISTGKKGEILGRDYLISLGYEFIASNYKTKFGEIDLIFKDGNILVLAEVKTRKGNQILEIEKTINRLKIKKILKSAEIYISKNDIGFDEIRVDAIFIILDRNTADGGTLVREIRHIKGFL